jgi:hypothetical protein
MKPNNQRPTGRWLFGFDFTVAEGVRTAREALGLHFVWRNVPNQI